MHFAELVKNATGGHEPYAYQQRLADVGLPDVLDVPTGSGKTVAAVLPWLHRRLFHSDPQVRAATPRWLVVVLPQRVLVEQTARVVGEWIARLGLDVPVHLLMGGEERADHEWRTSPANERIFIGTQDMVLSRLLMRGYAESAAAWPMTFGLLNSGVQFVFDEIQLLGPGLPTSLQLQGLREKLGSAIPCHTMWMSATVDRRQLTTVDLTRALTEVGLGDEDRVGPLATRLDATRAVRRLEVSGDAKRYPRELAAAVVAEHRAGTRTIVVVNTVDRAVDVRAELVKARPAATVVLLHSRFRPADRAARLAEAVAAPGPHGTIVVTTQVLEAGVDLTSDTLVTEVAPWSSIVQRAGRCNRDGLAVDARLLWTPPPAGRGSHLPYEAEVMASAEKVLVDLSGTAVTSADLVAATPDDMPPLHPVLRRRDLLDLFDTAPDLSGNALDVSQFVRDPGNRTVSVAWRVVGPDEPTTAATRAELCPAPIADVQELAVNGRAQVLDRVTGAWRAAGKNDVRPGAVVFLDAERGGYVPDTGFAARSTTPVAPVTVPERDTATQESLDDDPQSVGFSRWVSLSEHLADVEREADALLTAFGEIPGLTADQRAAVTLAGRYHDIGKAHPVFQASLERAARDGGAAPAPAAREPWAKSSSDRSRRRQPSLRHDPRHFRHELVSALLLLDEPALLSGVTEADLVVHLVLSHHGKVRVTVRGKPDEPADRLLGVEDGRSTDACVVPVAGPVPARPISLARTRLGAGSLTSRALALRDRADLGPFRVAFCEAVVRGADWVASASYEEQP